MTKRYSTGKGENTMWESVKVISRFVEDGLSEEMKEKLMREVYNIISTGHYNAEFAKEDISNMYYTDKNGNKHQAPYWPEDAVKSLYDQYSDEIPDYNFWDYYVTMNMLASDNWCMLAKWFPNASDSEMNEKLAEMSENWLKDEDWPTKTKIWDYLSSR